MLLLLFHLIKLFWYLPYHGPSLPACTSIRNLPHGGRPSSLHSGERLKTDLQKLAECLSSVFLSTNQLPILNYFSLYQSGGLTDHQFLSGHNHAYSNNMSCASFNSGCMVSNIPGLVFVLFRYLKQKVCLGLEHLLRMFAAVKKRSTLLPLRWFSPTLQAWEAGQ